MNCPRRCVVSSIPLRLEDASVVVACRHYFGFRIGFWEMRMFIFFFKTVSKQFLFMTNKTNNEQAVAQPTKMRVKKSEELTIIKAMERIVEGARGSKLSDAFWRSCSKPIAFLEERLQLTRMQIVLVCILAEFGDTMNWRMIGEYLDCTRLKIMTFSDEVKELLEKGWIVRKGLRDHCGQSQGYMLERGVVTALRNNRPFVPEKLDGLTTQEFVDRIVKRVTKSVGSRFHMNEDFEGDEEWLLRICRKNEHLPLSQAALQGEEIHDVVLLLLLVTDHINCVEADNEGITLNLVEELYPSDYLVDHMRDLLEDGTHPFFEAGLVEHKCVDGIADPSTIVLTDNGKKTLLAGYVAKRRRGKSGKPQGLRCHKTIQAKEMFYNAEDQAQIGRLVDMLRPANFKLLQERLEHEGFRKGFACLFYGAPGTGKTETVLQIARMTGRDIMQVDIATIRDKYVGETEKRIKSAFVYYRLACAKCALQPILFFNEADALFMRRSEDVQRSVDKMENAMQNIILQEMETLDGILIATTNLTSNLDGAFDRRFLFKIEFHQPSSEIRAKLWTSMISGLSEEDARRLAQRYDFTGGQIENVARKYVIDKILTGEPSTLDDLNNYCQCETLGGSALGRLGFC